MSDALQTNQRPEFQTFKWEIFPPENYAWISAEEIAQLTPSPGTSKIREAGVPYLLVPWTAARRPAQPNWSTGGAIAKAGIPRGRIYDPMEPKHRALFKQFAKVEPTPDGIIKFAREYGNLGLAVELGLSDEDEPFVFRKFGEALTDWVYEIEWMKHALEAHERLRARDTEWFRPHVEWPRPWIRHDGPPQGSVIYRAHPELDLRERPRWDHGTWLFHWDEGPFELGSLLSGDNLIGAANVLLMTLMNHRLARWTSVRLIWDDSLGRPTEHVVPQNLIGMMWLQAAQMVSGQRKYFSCAHCGLPFELSARSKRADARYCSKQCQYRAYRVRKKAGNVDSSRVRRKAL